MAEATSLLKVPWRYSLGCVIEYRWVGACTCGYRSKFHMSPGYAESAASEHFRTKHRTAETEATR